MRQTTDIQQYIKENDFVPLFVPYKGRILPTIGYYLNPEGVFIRVTADNTIQFLDYVPDKDGYNRQGIATVEGSKMCRMSILVASTFIPNPDPSVYTQVNHKNLVKNDDRVDNLEWVSSEGNKEHYLRNKSNAPRRKDYPILQCKVLDSPDRLLVLRRYSSIRDVPSIGFDGRSQPHNKVTHCCLDPKVHTFHGYVWLYEKDRPTKEKQGLTFFNDKNLEMTG